jgi:hypothetical protein
MICVCSGAAVAATIWQEDFSGYTNAGITGAGAVNYPGGITNWSLDVRACATLTPGSGSAGDCFMATATSGGRMEAVNVDGEAVWRSAVIDIGGFTNVSLSVLTSETGSSVSTGKYVKLFYCLNGGPETAFAVNSSNVGNWGSATASQSNLCGATVQIVARVNNPNAGDKSIFDTVAVCGDYVVVLCPPVLDPVGDRSVAELGVLSFAVTAGETESQGPVTLTAENLPDGAVFTNGLFVWSNAAPAGVYTVTFSARNTVGTDSETIQITVTPFVAESSRIAGYFYGWSGDTVFKFASGHFWQQSVSGSRTINPALRQPQVTVTNVSGRLRMIVTNVSGYVTVSPLTVTESLLTNTFSGLRYENIYQLADGTAWKQISFETVSNTASPVTVWRWTKNDLPVLRFVDRNDAVIGTCTAEAVDSPADAAVHSRIAGYFYGFGYGGIFHLSDGSWWRQISFERSVTERRDPDVLLWKNDGGDWMEMPDEDIRVTVEPLAVQREGVITNAFTGLHHGNLYRLDGGGDFLQLSFENIPTNIIQPNVMLWTDGAQTCLLVRDSRDRTLGTCTVAAPSADTDRDGLSNAAEVLAGFDPQDSQSAFELRQTDRNVLSWTAAAGRVYAIEWTPSLSEPFRLLEDGIAAPRNSWTDTVHSVETKGFYRVRVGLAD